jgi:uncharacterized protein YdiU (UPF0061 family)
LEIMVSTNAATDVRFRFENTYARDLEGTYVAWQPAAVPKPRLVILNHPLARELGLDPADLESEAGVAILAGNAVPEGAAPIAQAYAGHQFGGFSPRLGDGRALLLGEVVDTRGVRRDIQLKGSGQTPFSRNGDGKAALGPMLREYVFGEAMHALAIPTTRALAVVTTGEVVRREKPLPGAVLTRVAASHIRVGTFQFFAARSDTETVKRVADYAIARHYTDLAPGPERYLAFFAAVAERQAELVARWMCVGFVHGVMNTDNMAISGETIDYGPCAFIDAYDPRAVYSSIDHHGRYAFANQPVIAQWNLARLAETLIPLVDADAAGVAERLTGVLDRYAERFHHHWLAGMRRKLGLCSARDDDQQLVDDLLALLASHQLDWTLAFRCLSDLMRGTPARFEELLAEPSDRWTAWQARWLTRVAADPGTLAERAAAMDRENPLYIPRNHLVEEALAAATTDGDMRPVEALLDAVSRPYDERGEHRDRATARPQDIAPHVTYCGT